MPGKVGLDVVRHNVLMVLMLSGRGGREGGREGSQ